MFLASAAPALAVIEGFHDFSHLGRDGVLRTGQEFVANSINSMRAALINIADTKRLPRGIEQSQWQMPDKRILVDRQGEGFRIRVYDTEDGYRADMRK